ncbi:MAG: hypothetical protein CMJ32_09005 [Phycisphaerae bacterium]|nr:hypothetical protein [Phycisphaerae bacterium]
MSQQSTAGSSIASALLVRVVVPLMILALVSLQVVHGGHWIPQWILNMLQKWDIDPTMAARCIITIELAAVGLMIFMGRISRAIALASLAAIAFVSIGSFSAVMSGSEQDGTRTSDLAIIGAILLCCAVLLTLVTRSGPTGGRTSSGAGGSPNLNHNVAGVIVIVILAMVASSMTPMDLKPVGQAGGRPIDVIEIDFADMKGKRLPETPLARQLPELTALTLDGEHFVVFYRLTCPSCHEVFLDHFPGRQERDRVIAVNVPPEQGALIAEGANTEPIQCDGCTRMQLPEGPLWLLKTPAIMVVENGVITCASGTDVIDCLVGQ